MAHSPAPWIAKQNKKADIGGWRVKGPQMTVSSMHGPAYLNKYDAFLVAVSPKLLEYVKRHCLDSKEARALIAEAEGRFHDTAD